MTSAHVWQTWTDEQLEDAHTAHHSFFYSQCLFFCDNYFQGTDRAPGQEYKSIKSIKLSLIGGDEPKPRQSVRI